MDIEGGLPLMRIDGLLIEQVLINLLENAAAYTPDGSVVTISAVSNKPDIIIRVADNGAGIPEGDEEKIFDKFYASKGNDGGIGLAICRGIIHAHGGKIWAENASKTEAGGTGAIFSFSLPIKGTGAEA